MSSKITVFPHSNFRYVHYNKATRFLEGFDIFLLSNIVKAQQSTSRTMLKKKEKVVRGLNIFLKICRVIWAADIYIMLPGWRKKSDGTATLNVTLLSCDALPANTTIEWNDAHRKDKETQRHGLSSSQSINCPQCHQQPCVANFRENVFPQFMTKKKHSTD